MIVVTYKDIQNSNSIFREISEQQMSALTAYKIAQLIKELEEKNLKFDILRQQLIKQYGNENNEHSITVPRAKAQEFTKEMEKLLNSEIKIEANKLELEDLKEIKLTPKQMFYLSKFIK